MAILEIVKYPDERLRNETFDVEQVDDGIRELVSDMIDTMYSLSAAGIAAIQVGRFERIFIIDGSVATGEEDAEPLVLINPEIVETGGGLALSEEGCLSFPGVFVEIRRPRFAKLRALNVDGETFEAQGEGLFGRALQHEFDHLTGKLMIDLGRHGQKGSHQAQDEALPRRGGARRARAARLSPHAEALGQSGLVKMS